MCIYIYTHTYMYHTYYCGHRARGPEGLGRIPPDLIFENRAHVTVPPRGDPKRGTRKNKVTS